MLSGKSSLSTSGNFQVFRFQAFSKKESPCRGNFVIPRSEDFDAGAEAITPRTHNISSSKIDHGERE